MQDKIDTNPANSPTENLLVDPLPNSNSVQIESLKHDLVEPMIQKIIETESPKTEVTLQLSIGHNFDEAQTLLESPRFLFNSKNSKDLAQIRKQGFFV